MKKILLFLLIINSTFGQSTYINRTISLPPTISPLLSKTAALMQARQPIVILLVGDSLISSGDYFQEELQELFTQNYGYCGGGGNIIDSSFGRFVLNGKVTPAIGGGASYVVDFTRWWGNHVLLPTTGSQYQIGGYSTVTGFGSTPVMGNVFQVIFAMSNSMGGFALNTNGVELTRFVCNTNAGILETNVVWNYTNSVAIPVVLNVTTLSNFPVRIMSLGIFDFTKPGVVCINQGIGGYQLDNYNSVPTYARDAAYRSWNPNLVFFKTINGGSTIISNNLTAAIGFIQSNCPNAEFSISGIQPIQTGDSDVVSLNYALRKFCYNSSGTVPIPGFSYFNTHGLMADDWTFGLNQGYLLTGNNVHLTQAGSEFVAHALWDFLNLQGVRGLYNGIGYPSLPFEINVGGEIRFSGGNTNGGTNAIGVYHTNVRKASIDTNGLISVTGALVSGDLSSKTNYSSGVVSSNVAQVDIGGNRYPAGYTIFTMTANGSDTNITTTTNTLWGTGTGTRVLSNNFFTVGRTVTASIEGQYWDGGTPGGNRYLVMLNTTSATNILSQSYFTPPVSAVGEYFKVEVSLTCRATGASGSIDTTGTILTISAGTPTIRQFTNTLSTIDTTAAYVLDVASTNGAATDSWLGTRGNILLQ